MEKLISIVQDILKKRNSKKFNSYVKQFYKKNYTKRIKYSKNIWNSNKYWDFYFHSFPHCIKSSNYVPYDYYNYKILPNLNNRYKKNYVQDKNMFDKIFGNLGVKLPETIFRCMNNIFMDAHYNEIDNIGLCVKNIKQDIIIKKANDSHGGLGVVKYIYSNGSLFNPINKEEFDVYNYKKIFKGDFIVQAIVYQHEDLGKYHPKSLNTLKILTYRSILTNEIHLLLAHLRIGVNDSFVDNVTQGGLSVGINIDENYKATLKEFAFEKYGISHSVHPNTKIKYFDNKIQNFDLVMECIKKLSNIVPDQRIIGWDFSIDKFGKPVLIEPNYGSGIASLQLSNGKPLFGDLSQEVKEYLDQI